LVRGRPLAAAPKVREITTTKMPPNVTDRGAMLLSATVAAQDDIYLPGDLDTILRHRPSGEELG